MGAWETLKFLGVACAVFYVGLVEMVYATEGPRTHYNFGLNRPSSPPKRLLIALGTGLAAAILRMGRAALDDLFEASAQVGEWFIQRTRSEI